MNNRTYDAVQRTIKALEVNMHQLSVKEYREALEEIAKHVAQMIDFVDADRDGSVYLKPD